MSEQRGRRSVIVLDDRDDPVKERPIHEWFSRAARKTSELTGTAWAFAIAFLIILSWIVSGPIFGFSDTWQLVINTGTTIVTFLMIFLVQHTQNKDTAVIHVKLNELIASQRGASNHLIDLEDMTEADLERLRIAFQRLADRASEKGALGRMTVEQVVHAINEETAQTKEQQRPRSGHSSRS